MNTTKRMELDKKKAKKNRQDLFLAMLVLTPLIFFIRDVYLFCTHFLKTGKILDLTVLNFLKNNIGYFKNLYINENDWIGLKLIFDNTLGVLPVSFFVFGVSWFILWVCSLTTEYTRKDSERKNLKTEEVSEIESETAPSSSCIIQDTENLPFNNLLKISRTINEIKSFNKVFDTPKGPLGAFIKPQSEKLSIVNEHHLNSSTKFIITNRASNLTTEYLVKKGNFTFGNSKAHELCINYDFTENFCFLFKFSEDSFFLCKIVDETSCEIKLNGFVLKKSNEIFSEDILSIGDIQLKFILGELELAA